MYKHHNLLNNQHDSGTIIFKKTGSTESLVLHNFDLSKIIKMWIDDVLLDQPVKEYTFGDTDIHTIEIMMCNMLGDFGSFVNCLEIDLSHFNSEWASSFEDLFSNNTYLTSISGLENLKTKNVTTFFDCFRKCSSLEEINLSEWEMDLESTAHTYNGIFQNCTSLRKITLPKQIKFNGEERNMFDGCTNLETIVWNNSDISAGENSTCLRMFRNCYKIKDISFLAKLKSFGWCSDMFRNTNIEDFSSIEGAHKASSPGGMFAYTKCKTIDLSKWTIVGNLSNTPSSDCGMFEGCSYLETVVLPSTLPNNKANRLFLACTKLTDVSGCNSFKPINTSEMFSGCSSIQTLDLTGWDFSACETMQSMFYNCISLTSLTITSEVLSTTITTDMFSGVETNGVFYYNPDYDYSHIIAVLPETWTAQPLN